MPVNLDWLEIALRLFLTVIAGGIIGLNRGERGHAAGLRTTLLVCLAASIAMIQVNLLLGLSGRHPDTSFVMNDLMRLPLGILSGMGFIGAGAILRRDDRVIGVTTAATLWFVTVLGLCIGGGQYILGMAALLIAIVVLWGLKWMEGYIPQERRGILAITVGSEGVTDDTIRQILSASNVHVDSLAMLYDISAKQREFVCELKWREISVQIHRPEFLEEVTRLPSVTKVHWDPKA